MDALRCLRTGRRFIPRRRLADFLSTKRCERLWRIRQDRSLAQATKGKRDQNNRRECVDGRASRFAVARVATSEEVLSETVMIPESHLFDRCHLPVRKRRLLHKIDLERL